VRRIAEQAKVREEDEDLFPGPLFAAFFFFAN